MIQKMDLLGFEPRNMRVKDSRTHRYTIDPLTDSFFIHLKFQKHQIIIS